MKDKSLRKQIIIKKEWIYHPYKNLDIITHDLIRHIIDIIWLDMRDRLFDPLRFDNMENTLRDA